MIQCFLFFLLSCSLVTAFTTEVNPVNKNGEPVLCVFYKMVLVTTFFGAIALALTLYWCNSNGIIVTPKGWEWLYTAKFN